MLRTRLSAITIFISGAYFLVTAKLLFMSWMPCECPYTGQGSAIAGRHPTQIHGFTPWNSNGSDDSSTVHGDLDLREASRPLRPTGEQAADLDESSAESGVKILLVGKARYGSTFLGQFLNVHPDIMYIFEPIRAVHLMARSGAIPKSLIDACAVEILQNLYGCYFPNYFVHSNFMSWKIGVFNSKVIRLFCGSENDCTGRETEDFSVLCQLYNHIAIKVIRLTSVALLERLVTTHNYNLKIIFLVRDPRAVALSRRTMKFPPRRRNESLLNLQLVGPPGAKLNNLSPENVNYDCARFRENLRVIEDPPEWLRGRIILLRHEDVAMDTLGIVEDIYKFVGVDIDESVRTAVQKHTQSKEGATDNNMETRRNSTTVVHAWRNGIYYDDVIAIQAVCGDVMERLGYELVESEDQLRDIQNFKVF
ncbi:carbohydrate sulfotransferase 1-like [Ptychodera flava]|uniref:carbohydrate sulfotransferase 1-like n=1 Tax=Ptychodera flava TaxID=63121 RepID=UPI003969D205